MWINHTRGVGVDKDQVRDTISTTKADDQKDNEADELPPEAYDPHEHDEEQDLYEDMDDFAPMDLDGNYLPPVAPTAMGTNTANVPQDKSKSKFKAVESNTVRSASDTAAFDAWKASVTGGELDDNSTIYAKS